MQITKAMRKLLAKLPMDKQEWNQQTGSVRRGLEKAQYVKNEDDLIVLNREKFSFS